MAALSHRANTISLVSAARAVTLCFAYFADSRVEAEPIAKAPHSANDAHLLTQHTSGTY
jgi:hypothetical protein